MASHYRTAVLLASCLFWPAVPAAVFAADPVAAAASPYAEWKHSGNMFILTTPEGADLPTTAVLENFPLLVRLHRDFFDFRQARPQGEDLRISADGRPLAYRIEEWNPAAGTASVWVRIPRIQGNSRQEIRLHWGHPTAASESNGKNVYDEANGYFAVWHMDEPLRDDVGSLTVKDVGTTAVPGMIGPGRHLAGKQGMFGGDKIPNLPVGAASHSTEAWVRAERSNATIVAWGNEEGGRGSKIRMQLRSPPHLRIDSNFSDVKGEGRLPLGEWIHIVHTYDREDGKVYVNGRLDGSARPLLNLKSPARLWIGGWYNNYDFVGDLDEVRISRVARSADWIKLQYENQKPRQTAVGPLVQPGDEFSVSQPQLTVAEGSRTILTARAGGAQKIQWSLIENGKETVLATDRFAFEFAAGRTQGNASRVLRFRAILPRETKSIDIPVTITEAVPDPEFTLSVPAVWDGRKPLELTPNLVNLDALQRAGAGPLRYEWKLDNLAATAVRHESKLILTRAHNSGRLDISLSLDNGGAPVSRTATIEVTEPPHDAWIAQPPAADELPSDGRFYACDDTDQATLHCVGTLKTPAEQVFLRITADGKPFSQQFGPVSADGKYAISARLKPGLVKYACEFGSRAGAAETVLHRAENMICGDAYLIEGQSNAVATDVGRDDPPLRSPWIRTFGGTSGNPQAGRSDGWGEAVVRDRNGGKMQIGYWGMKLAERLVADRKVPICILNGAVGGTRIDQHQRNPLDSTDDSTIYGRLLRRVRQAGLTHGIRGILWHQGENDQGADGPDGRWGWETYRQLFIEMAGAWQEDYPNVRNIYVFQIRPRACAMGSGDSDHQLREVQRTLPRYFSKLRVMSTLGIRPTGGCHYPLEGYAQFAELIAPLVERDRDGTTFDRPIDAPNLRRAYFTDEHKQSLVLEFDQEIVWTDTAANQFLFDGKVGRVASGTAAGNRLTLALPEPLKAATVSYPDTATWGLDRLLVGRGGIAALTFCDVPIGAAKSDP